jgi:glycosyltransferase involved in cell wall biosynthesis
VAPAHLLTDETAVVVTHHATTGPSDALETYLRDRRRRLVVIEHGFGEAAGEGTTVRVWDRGVLVRERRVRWDRRIPGPLTWIKDFVLSLSAPWWARGRADAYVGIDSLNAAAGIALRALGLVGRVAFWTIDYAPDRFGSTILNRIYFALDRLCVTRSDETWNLSPRMEEGRAERGVRGAQRVVPMGATRRPPVDAAYPHRIVHMGSLLAKQGVQVAIEALPLVRAQAPDSHLLVIGDGPFRAELEALAARLGVTEAVQFTGYVEDHAEVEQLIAASAVALATYDPGQVDFTYYADPGKIKTYLAAGVPVVVTDVPWSAGWVADEGAGVLVEYRPEDVARGVLELFGDGAAREAAGRLGRTCDWERIFDDAFDTQPREQTNANE